MNQRFTRLAKRRCILIELSAKKKRNQKSSTDNQHTEYTDVRTAHMSPEEVVYARKQLPVLIRNMLENFSEDSVWESIAVRYLTEKHHKDKRCGRPTKYPLPIPIPSHLLNGGHLSRKKMLLRRPSDMGYDWASDPDVRLYGGNPSDNSYASKSPSDHRSTKSPSKQSKKQRTQDGKSLLSSNINTSNSASKKIKKRRLSSKK
jgi:hypothetical protein